MSDRNLPVETCRNLIAGALVRSRTSDVNAFMVADALVAAELAGQTGHGLRRVSSYAAQSKSGKVDGHAVPTVRQVRPAVISVDAANGFAYPALDLMFEPLADVARSQGIAMAGIRRSHHCGVAGNVVERYADAGLVALFFANTPAAMAPLGTRRTLFGTNPIAFACPIADDDPIVVDLSLSQVARGRIMAAHQKGERIPEGWAFDADGQPTTDAERALSGMMAPLGGAKGIALALMVELLAAGLTGANYAADASSFFTADGSAPGVGQLLIAIDPAALSGDAVLSHLAALAAEIEDAGGRLPGRRRQSIRSKLTLAGIPVDERLIAEIEAIGGKS